MTIEQDIERLTGRPFAEFIAAGGVVHPSMAEATTGERGSGARRIDFPAEPTPAYFAEISEKTFTRLVIGFARGRGWRVAHFRTSQSQSGKWITAVQGDGAGFPDLIMVRGSVALAVELKVKKNEPSVAQAAWLEAFRAAGIDSRIWKPKDWPEIQEVLR